MVDIARLTVRLEAENAKLTKSLNKSNKDLRKFEGQAKKSSNAVKSSLGGIFAGLGAGLSIAGLSSAVSRALDANDEIAKLSTSTGIAVEELHGLDLAAQLSGTSLESVAKGAGRLQRNMFDAVAGLKESKDSFDALGVSVQNNDGTLRDTEDVLLDVAERFAAMEDGAGKAALAQRLFGRAGTQLIPLLNQGRDTISKYVDEQQRLGNVLTEDVARASERVNDNFTRLDVAAEGMSRSLTAGMLPALESITAELVRTAEGSNDATKEIGEFAGDILRVGVSALLALKAGLDTTGNAIGRWAAIVVTAAGGDFKRAFEIMQDETGGFVDEYTQAAESIKAVWSDIGDEVSSNADADANKIAAPVILAAVKAKKAAKEIKDAMDIALDLAVAEEEDLTKQEGKKIAGLDGPTESEKRATQLFEETRTPAENLSTEISELNTLLDDGEISFDTYSRAVFAVQDEFEGLAEKTEETGDRLSVFAEQAARNMQDDFAQFLFDPFQEDGLKGMLNGFVDTLRQMAAQAAAAKIFEAIGGAASGSENSFIAGIGSFFSATTRATGGPLAKGQASLIGERGPELFIPATAGTVIPNHQLGGAAPVTVNVTAPPGRDSQSASQFGFEVAQALSLAQRRNG